MQQLFIMVWRFILDGVFPAHCLGCGNEGVFLCSSCQKLVPKLREQVCPWCYKPNIFGKSCDECANPERFLDGLISCSKFSEHSVLQKAVHHFKYDFIKELSSPLGFLLTEVFLERLQNFQENFVFCPVPLHLKRQRWRGFNQSELLCSKVVEKLREEGFANLETHRLLDRMHFSKPQMELQREDRIKNVEDAFRIREKIPGRFKKITIVLVDDIATTLSTLNSAAGVLKKAGFERVYGLVLARVF